MTTVCVTGATGYVASEVVRQCLALGWTVRGTVRDPTDTAKNGFLTKMADGSPGKLELAKGDLLTPGSFDDVVKGCKYVFHMASPFVLGLESEGVDAVEEKLIKPALLGTTTVLESVAKHKDTIECVALTSSMAAVRAMGGKPSSGSLFTENDWNESATREKGAYMLSKTLAEKAAWEIAERENFKLCTINPSFVIGPPNTDRDDGESIGFALTLLKTGKIDKNGLNLIDVRDVAKAHIEACTNPNSGGRYCMASANPYPAWLIYEILEPTGIVPGLEKVAKPKNSTVSPSVDCSKVQSSEGQGLGIALTDPAQTLQDMLESMKNSHGTYISKI